MDTINSIALEKQDYSCARCRRLKKKCTKESPTCSLCARVNATCTYPGRAPRRTKKELREAMQRGEFVPVKRRKKTSKDGSSSTSVSVSPEDIATSSAYVTPSNATPSYEQLPPQLKKNDSNISLPSLNAIYNDMYSNVMKSVNNNTHHVSLPVSTTATVATTPPMSIPNMDTPLYESVSSLISSLSASAHNTITSANGNNPNNISKEQGHFDHFLRKEVPSASTIDIGSIDKIDSNALLSSAMSPGTASDLSVSLNMNQSNPTNIPRAYSLPSLSTGTPQHELSQNNNNNKSSQNVLSQQLNKIDSSNNSPDSIRLSPRSNFNKNSFSNVQTESTNPAKYTNTKSAFNRDMNNSANVDTYNIENINSTPISSASIEMATIGTVFKGGRIGTWLNDDGSVKPIDRNLLDRFIAAYFRHNHRLFPMIDKVAFLNQVSQITELDYDKLNKKYDGVFIFKVYMIMAIGCTTLRRAGMLLKDEEELSEHLAFLAMEKFCHIIGLQNMETIRCLLLLGIYSFFEPKGWSSWTISGIIMRLTIGMGLNRDLGAKKMKDMSILEVEGRYRVFWSAYCFERLIATCIGRVSAIDDDDIAVPLPRPLNEAEKEDIDVTNTMIILRRLAGRIYKQVHSTCVSKKKLTTQERTEVIQSLRQELDTVFETEKLKMKQHNDITINATGTSTISFHSSDIWLAMRYSQLMILLYRPSVLIPKPPIESLSILGQYCLEAWKHTYTLYQKKLLPLNWITLFRTLTICNIILYCLCQWAIDLIESKIEIQQCAEILDHFGSKWVFAKKCAEVFRNISNTILEISLSDGNVPNMNKLTIELFGANDAYHEILDENNVDVSWADKLV
ncbi:protein Stb5p [Monosporozyma servazzii]